MRKDRLKRKQVFKNHDQPVPLRFQGELMTCALCHKQHRSHPNKESNWRSIGINGQFFYICTDHFPPDEQATVEVFETAYRHVIRLLMEKMNGGDQI